MQDELLEIFQVPSDNDAEIPKLKRSHFMVKMILLELGLGIPN